MFPFVFLNKTNVETISGFSITNLLMGLIFVLISIFLLRPSKCKEILQRFNIAEPTVQINKVVSNDEVASND